jgi:hypothetical protein
LSTSALSVGNVRGTVYTFPSAGDVLELHTHDENTAHITIVARGRVKMIVAVIENGVRKDVEEHVLETGQAIDTAAGVLHEFVTLADDSRIYNIIKTPKL